MVTEPQRSESQGSAIAAARSAPAPSSSGMAAVREPIAARLLGRPWIWIALVVLIFLLPMVRTLLRAMSPPPLDVLTTVPEWRLIDQDGRPFGARELRGHVYVADFIFTTCTYSCPRLTSRMASLQPRLRALPGGVRLVSISVDPTHDTPERLREYAQRYHADTAMWTFVTARDEQEMQAVARGFLAGVSRGERLPDGTWNPVQLAHSNRFALVDAQGRMRGSYDADDEGLARLVRDAERLASGRQ